MHGTSITPDSGYCDVQKDAGPDSLPTIQSHVSTSLIIIELGRFFWLV